MELNQVLEARRSIRHYQDQPVDLTLIGQMIEAAILSPSWKNSQTARYHVVSSPEMLEKIKTDCLPDFNQKNCQDAPVLIICTFVKTVQASKETVSHPMKSDRDGDSMTVVFIMRLSF